MNIVSKKIEDLKPYKNNPRKHPEKSVEFVANSIKEFGFKVPILIDKNNEIIAGHTRLLASQKLGLEKVPCIVVDDLTPEQVKAFRIADNKVSEFSEWDDELLMTELDGLFGEIDMADFGFNMQVENLMEHIEEPEQVIAGELGEANNYIVLEFKTEIDWDKAQTVFNLQEVYSNRENKNVRNKGIGRVIDGAEVIKRLINVED